MPRACRVASIRLPSLTGTDALELSGLVAELPSRRVVFERVREALLEAEASPDPTVLLVVAEWGEGKTSIYNGFLEPYARSRGWATLAVRTASVLAYLEGLESLEKSPAYRLLAAILAAGLEARGLLARVGSPSRLGLRGFVREALKALSGGRRLLVFVDEFEDVVTRSGGVVSEAVEGLVGILNGDVEEARGDDGAVVHLVLSLTPPAYMKLMGYRDFATVAARLKRRVRVIRVPPLSRAESYRFLEALARYSLGDGFGAVLESDSMVYALASCSLGNMGALVSVFRYIVSRSRALAEDSGCSGLTPLGDGELVRSLSKLTLSIGGADLPAVNMEVYSRLVEGLESALKLAGMGSGLASRLLDILLARGAVPVEEASKLLGVDAAGVWELVAEANRFAEASWVSRELNARRLVYRVRLVDAYEEARRLLSRLEPELEKRLRLVGGSEAARSVLDSLLVYREGRILVAVPVGAREAVDLVADSSPIDLSSGEAERLASLLWEHLFSKLGGGVEALLLSPRVSRAVYVSPELQYLDFIYDRLERFQTCRRVYSEGGRLHLLLGVLAVLAREGSLAGCPVFQSESTARVHLQLPGQPRATARVLVHVCTGGLTAEEAKRVEGQVSAAVLSSWKPHAVVVVYHGEVEEEALRILEALERKLFMRVVVVQLPALVDKVKLMAYGVRIASQTGDPEKALQLAVEAATSRSLAEELGFEPHRLECMLREMAETLSVQQRVRSALEEGVEGAPILIRDPQLAYDVERPTELSGALRYYLAVPASRATPREALAAAHEYVMRYHLYRHGGGEARGLMSPDIDRREVTTLERYTALLIANRMLERVNGGVRIDVLSPAEKAVVMALEQAGAASDWVQASTVWDHLVVQAQNPGTRRMLLQALAYRGIVEVSSRRVDPERSRVRLVYSSEHARRMIEEARKLIKLLGSDTELASWSCIVVAKARDYRCGCLEELLAKMERLLDTAEEALKAGNLLMALRLARLVLDLLDYYRDEPLSWARRALESARRLRTVLSELLARWEEARQVLQQLLREYVVEGQVEVVDGMVEAVERLLEEMEKLWSMRPREEEVEEEARRLWSIALRQSAREPGKHTPFYVNGDGPKVFFNYKYWLLARKAMELGVAELGSGGLEPSARLRRRIEDVEELVEEVREAVERAEKLARRMASLSQKLRVAGGVEVHLKLPRLPAPRERLELEEVRALVEAWRARLEEELRPLEELEKSATRLVALVEELRGMRAKALVLAGEARREAEEAKKAGIDEAYKLVVDAVSRLEEVLERCGVVEKRLAELGAASPHDLLARMTSLVDEAERLQRDLGEALKRVEAASAEARRIAEAEAERLKVEAEALARLVGADKPGEYGGNVYSMLATLRRWVEELRVKVAEERLLTGTELDAYLVVVEEKRRRRELLLGEAARLVSERLGIGFREARAVLVRLIERGLIEPKI